MNLFKRKKQNTQTSEKDAYTSLIGLNCEIAKEDGAILGYGKVISENDDEIEITFSHMIRNFSYDKPIRLTFYNDTDNNLVLTTNIVSSHNLSAMLKITDRSVLTNHRSNFRTRVFIPGTLLFDPTLDEDNDDSIEYEVQINDISLTGLMLMCEAELNVGDSCVVCFRLPTETMYLPSVIKRRIHRPDNIHRQYGLEFCEPTQKQVDIICQFLFLLDTAMRQLRTTSLSEFKLFENSWELIREWSRSYSEKTPSMLGRYNRKGIAGKNNFFRKN